VTTSERVEPPLLTVVRGAPDDEELAAATIAVLGLLRARGGDGRAGPRPAQAGWVIEGYRSPGAWAAH
jgi:hypothetical protein